MNKKLRNGIAAAVITAAVAAGVFEFAAVDTAGDSVSLAEAQAMKDSGVKLFVQALTWWPSCSRPASQPSTRIDSLRNAQQVGLETAGYLLVDSHLSGREAVQNARNGVPDDVWNKLEFVAVDFEIPTECYNAGTSIPYQTVIDALNVLAEMGMPKVLYTSYGEWGSRMTPPNPPIPADVWIWEASWDNDSDVDFDNHPFGGATASQVFLEQFNGGTSVAGVYVDLNSMSKTKPYPWLSRSSCPSGEANADGLRWDGCAQRWTNDSGWSYDPTAMLWYGPDGAAQWTSCNADRLRWALGLDAWMPVGGAFYAPPRGYWSVAPPC